MEWTEAIREAVSYIEKYITEDITMYDVADHVHISPFYFHKGFGILCGYILTTRITMRRYGFQLKAVFGYLKSAVLSISFTGNIPG